MLVWGFFSALGWMAANYTVEKLVPEKDKKEEQICTTWVEEKQPDNTVIRSRTCTGKSTNSP